MKKVAVGLSGGVDSAVCLLLLKEQGYEVVGVHMQCWDYNEEGCTGEKDKADAVALCSQLDVPFKFLDFQKEYQEKVIQNFYDEYEAGRTPNPDILCNKEIKFGLFYNWAIKEGFDYIATGHYAKIVKEDNFYLKIPKDRVKDQTYFLYRIEGEKLSRILFPLGDMLKDEVREIAFQNSLKVFGKPESMGICFIGKVNIKDFLKRRLSEKPGVVINAKGDVIGKHRGIPFYTIGQRHGFEVFKYTGSPMYVIEKIAETNTLVVGTEEETLRQDFYITNFSFINAILINEKNLSGTEVFCRIRHQGELVGCRVIDEGDEKLKVYLNKKISGIAEGQSCVFYSHDDKVLGGGIIS